MGKTALQIYSLKSNYRYLNSSSRQQENIHFEGVLYVQYILPSYELIEPLITVFKVPGIHIESP